MATAEAITYCGARPVFVDVDERTYTMDPSRLGQKRLPNGPGRSFPSIFFGQTADMDPIVGDCPRAQQLPVIEDAAQSAWGRV